MNKRGLFIKITDGVWVNTRNIRKVALLIAPNQRAGQRTLIVNETTTGRLENVIVVTDDMDVLGPIFKELAEEMKPRVTNGFNRSLS
jgi:hypothetical protein